MVIKKFYIPSLLEEQKVKEAFPDIINIRYAAEYLFRIFKNLGMLKVEIYQCMLYTSNFVK